MHTVVAPLDVEGEPIKGSRFLAFVRPVTDQDAALVAIEAIKAAHPQVRHHCWALRLVDPFVERASDAGEPSGSAGRPILSAIIGREITDVLMVVSRYFGGVKLGVGGLVRAYGGAAAAALDQAELAPRVATVAVELQHGYEDGAVVEQVLAKHDVASEHTDYADRVRRQLRVPQSAEEPLRAALRDATAGRVILPRSTDTDR